jgi:hypothetical protein
MISRINARMIPAIPIFKPGAMMTPSVRAVESSLIPGYIPAEERRADLGAGRRRGKRTSNA